MKRTLFLMLAVLLSTLSASAYDFKVDGIAYNYYSPYDVNRYNYYVKVAKGGDYTGSITIPNKVGSLKADCIESDAFTGCTGLTSITIPNSVCSIDYGAFDGCTGLTSVTFNAEECYSTSVGSKAMFKDSPLTSLVFGNDVQIIPGCIAYNQTGLKTITLPESATRIGPSAFEGCTGLTSVTIGNSVTEIYERAFEGCTGLTSITVPNSVTKIDRRAFANCTGLTSFPIPQFVLITRIYEQSFSGCTGLTSVTIPTLVTEIAGRAFADCTGLTSVTIPNSVTNILGKAFEGCTGLKKIYSFNPKPPVIAEDTFSSYDACLFVPKGCVPKYKEAEYWKNFKSIKEITYVGNNDINGDGMIDMVDVTTLINMILDQ